MRLTLIDSGPIIAYYSSGDGWHAHASRFLGEFTGQFVTTVPVIAEVMWMLKADYRVQNEFLRHLLLGMYWPEELTMSDFSRIAVLNEQYADLPGSFADLSLIAISERLGIADIASLDADFDVYRRYGKETFNRVFPVR